MKHKNIIPMLFFLLLHICGNAKSRSAITTGTIYLNLDQASVGPGYLDIPVYYESPDFIQALDLALKFNESKLSYESIVDTVSYIHYLANYSASDQTLRFTSYDYAGAGYSGNTPLFSIRFHASTNTIYNSDLIPVQGYLNGEVVPMKSIGRLRHYVIDTTTGNCVEPSFCLPVRALDSIKNVIGYDFSLEYDKTKVQPTGAIFVGNDLIDSSYVSFATNTDTINGQIHISLFLNATAPSSSFFQGIGRLVCVEFIKKPGLKPVDTVSFNIPFIQESYINGVAGKPVDGGIYINKKNSVYNALLKFWSDNSPIAYDSLNPSHYLITNIYGTDSSCHLVYPPYILHPDLMGHFSYNLLYGSHIKIERDILPTTDVQPVINGFDASLGHKVLVSNMSFIPNIFQIIALDVNLDGIISAGDISQINQRSVKTIPEFKQAWNYDNNGTSNGQPSKDWLFVDSVLLTMPVYKISSTYPLNDGIGYSKAKVPAVPFCLPLPVLNTDSCFVHDSISYTGILLGDVDGNYDAISPDGVLKRLNEAKGRIRLNMERAVFGPNSIDIPVSFTSDEEISSLDFAIRLNETKLHFEGLTKTASYLTDVLTNFSADDHTLRFTSNSLQTYERERNIAYMRFTFTGKFDVQYLKEMRGYLNGELVRMEMSGQFPNGINPSFVSNYVQIYPNPASKLIHILPSEAVTVELLDLQGQNVMISVLAPTGEIQKLDISALSSGTYLLKVYNDHFVGIERILIRNE